MSNKQIAYFIGFTAVCLWSVFYIFKVQNRENPNWIKTIESDGFGYYRYLPAILHNDFDYGFEKALVDVNNYELGAPPSKTKEGRNYTKYFCGVALLQSPFFMISWVSAKLMGYPTDGYSLPFQFGMFIASLFYFLAALFMINRVLIRCGVKPFTSFITLVAFVFATNAANYVWNEASFSHTYALSLVSVFIYYLHTVAKSPTYKSVTITGLIIGLILVTRPTTILAVLFLPLFFSNIKEVKKPLYFILKSPQLLVVTLIAALLPIAIQSCLYFLQTGEFWIYAYGEEGFNFLQPEISNFLLSYQKGWFVYTPVFALMFVGLFYWVYNKNQAFKAISFLFGFSVVVWVLSSWWMWFYGGSYGMRSMIDFYPIFIIPVAVGIQQSSTLIRVVLIGIIGFLSVINLVQNYQYFNQIIHYSEMDKDRYWQVFMDTSDDARFITYSTPKFLYNKEIIDSVLFTFNYSKGTIIKCQDKVFEENTSLNKTVEILSKNQVYSCGFDIPLHSDSNFNSIVVNVQSSVKSNSKTCHAIMVLGSKEPNKFWAGQKVSQLLRQKNEWATIQRQFLVKDQSVGDALVTHFINETNSLLYISDLKVTVYYCNDISKHE